MGIAPLGERLYCLADGELLLSAPDIDTWTAVSRTNGKPTALAKLPAGDRVLVGHADGTLAALAPDDAPSVLGRCSGGRIVALAALQAGTSTPMILAATDERQDGATGITIWRSADGGAQWDRLLDIAGAFHAHLSAASDGRIALLVIAENNRILTADPLAADPAFQVADLAAQAGGVRAVTAFPWPDGIRIAAATEAGLIVSDDGGATFRAMPGGPRNACALAAAAGALYVSCATGETWAGTPR